MGIKYEIMTSATIKQVKRFLVDNHSYCEPQYEMTEIFVNDYKGLALMVSNPEDVEVELRDYLKNMTQDPCFIKNPKTLIIADPEIALIVTNKNINDERLKENTRTSLFGEMKRIQAGLIEGGNGAHLYEVNEEHVRAGLVNMRTIEQ